MSMHEETHLLDGMGEIGPRERQVLQRTSQAAIEGSVGEGLAITS
jgi:hypothetical protein